MFLKRIYIGLMLVPFIFLYSYKNGYSESNEYSRHVEINKFQDYKFGLFIHWGPASGHEKFWTTTEDVLKSEAKTFSAEATKFNAKEWINIALSSGAKYLTVVTKHHDGFCLFDTKLTSNRSKVDYVASLTKEAKMNNLPIFFYYSMSDPFRADYKDAGKFHRYNKYVRGQIKELSIIYKPDGIWFDGWPQIIKYAKKVTIEPQSFYEFDLLSNLIREISPGVLIGNKEYFKDKNNVDFRISESLYRTQLGKKISEKIPTEICNTLPSSIWFSKTNKQNLNFTKKEIIYWSRIYIKRLISAIGRGMNYLLNTGPLPSGELQVMEAEILKKIGKWLSENGEAVYGTRKGPIPDANWGHNVIKNNIIFLHIFNNQIDNDINRKVHKVSKTNPIIKKGMHNNKKKKITIKKNSIKGKIIKVYQFPSGDPVPFVILKNEIVINLKDVLFDQIDTIVAIELEKVI